MNLLVIAVNVVFIYIILFKLLHIESKQKEIIDHINHKNYKQPNHIDIRYHDEIYGKLERIKPMHYGDYVDLRSAEDVELKKGEYKLISLGVSMKLPDGYFAKVLPRSSTYKNFKIIQTNSEGIIDNSYSGDGDIWRFPAYALEDATIKKGDRICQFTIAKKEFVDFREVEKLKGPNRGGIGSTGIK